LLVAVVVDNLNLLTEVAVLAVQAAIFLEQVQSRVELLTP
jgi:hypothetical protein